MKVILVNPSFKNFASIQPPLGLAYLSAVLRNKNADLSIIDANAEKINKDKTVEKIIQSKPDIIGFFMTTPLVTSVTEMAIEIKKINPAIKIIAGGPHPTVMPEDVLISDAFDIIVRGEGENTIQEVYDFFIADSIKLEGIKGISYKKGKKIIHDPDRPFIENLDNLPFPAWEYFPIKKYGGAFRKTNFALPIMTSRGCPFNCSFCYKGIFGNKYRYRSPNNVVEEIKYLKSNFKIKEFSIIDDSFTTNMKNAINICDLLIKEKIDMPWCTPNGIRTDCTSEELFLKMKRAGCYRIYMAIECGDQQIINNLNKNITIEQAEKAFKLAKKVGLETGAFFMIGNIGENKNTMEKTINLAKKIDPDFVQFTIATPYPGTKFFNTVKNEGELLIDNWEDLASFKKAAFKHKGLTPELINKMHKKAIKSFYLRPKFITKYIKNNMSKNGIKNIINIVKKSLKILN